jgi:SulP family sulfate permease
MHVGPYKFDRLEFSGSLGDLGTLIPLIVAMIIITGLSATTAFLMVGVFYIMTWLYFKLPIPVQPLKVVAAISIASPLLITESVLMATGIIIGIILLLLAFTGIMNWLARLFTKPIIRGIQLGLGFILLNKGLDFIMKSELFIAAQDGLFITNGFSANTFIGILSVLSVLLLISNKKFPSALVIVTAGVLLGILFGSLHKTAIALGPVPFRILALDYHDFLNAFILLVIPQIPLTIGNAILGTADACQTYFRNDKSAKKVTPKNLSLSMGMMNILIGIFGGIPLCHGAGGLAAHHRFGARTGGANIMIGLIFIFIALLFGQIAISLLSLIPNAILGTLLLFSGIELAYLIKDVTEKKDLFITILVAGIGFATTNMGVALIAGYLVDRIFHLKHINF